VLLESSNAAELSLAHALQNDSPMRRVMVIACLLVGGCFNLDPITIPLSFCSIFASDGEPCEAGCATASCVCVSNDVGQQAVWQCEQPLDLSTPDLSPPTDLAESTDASTD
jgi:hypothetical protein